MPDGFGKYEVYAVAGSRYCYSESSVLRNKLDIHDGVLLRQAEADISAARQTDMMAHPVAGRFTISHLCRIHKRLLGDIYPFAGHLRHEDIAKGETRFLAHEEIKNKVEHLFSELRCEHWLGGMPADKLIQRAAYYMAELNYAHPFREGNGRTMREFMRMLFLRNGYRVDWSAVPVDELMQAMVDSVYDTTHLERVLRKCLKEER